MIQKFEFKGLDMKGAYEITPFYATDERGGFIKDYNIDAFKQNGIDHELKEVFYTISKKGVIRAMHFRRLYTYLSILATAIWCWRILSLAINVVRCFMVKVMPA